MIPVAQGGVKLKKRVFVEWLEQPGTQQKWTIAIMYTLIDAHPRIVNTSQQNYTKWICAITV